MNQMTLRGLDAELERVLRHIARSERISLNQAALRLIRRGAGLDVTGQSSDTVGDALDHLIGQWTEQQADEVMDAVQVFEKVDESMWQ
jgi:hypothetical protein